VSSFKLKTAAAFSTAGKINFNVRK
jgi:hypothetical protein